MTAGDLDCYFSSIQFRIYWMTINNIWGTGIKTYKVIRQAQKEKIEQNKYTLTTFSYEIITEKLDYGIHEANI